MLENVKNLMTHDSGKTFKVILKCLKNIGYHVKYQCLSTDEYTDIPQGRERIYIICFINIY